MRKAVIDIGTNTFNLLIAEVDIYEFNPLHSAKFPVLLGMGGINHDLITDDAMDRAKEALKNFSETCAYYDVETISGIGTSALRGASNGQELIDFARTELNIKIQIVTGIEEAELIYSGVKWTFPFVESTVIMDIGGGSTEFINADSKGIQFMTSLDIGVSRIFQTMNKPDQFNHNDYTTVTSFLNHKACDFFENVSSNVLVGSSGSFETLYELIFKERFIDNGKSVQIPMSLLLSELDKVIYSSLDDRMANEWIVPIRKKMIPISAIKIKWAIEKLEIDQFYVSPYSLKEGVLTRLIK